MTQISLFSDITNDWTLEPLLSRERQCRSQTAFHFTDFVDPNTDPTAIMRLQTHLLVQAQEHALTVKAG